MSKQYKTEMNILRVSLEGTTEKLTATQLNFDLHAQSSLELAKQLKDEENMLESCQEEKDKV